MNLGIFAAGRLNNRQDERFRRRLQFATLAYGGAALGYHFGSRFSRNSNYVKQNMPPVTRSQKRSASRSRTPTRNTRRRIMPTPPSSGRGRTMTRNTSANRSSSGSRSLVRWMNSNARRMGGGYVSSLTKSNARLRTSRKLKAAYRYRTPLIYKGVTRVIETGGIVQDSELVYIGHSAPLFEMKYCAWWALFKRLFVKIGVNVAPMTDTQSLTALGFDALDEFRLEYKGNATATISPLNVAVGALTVAGLINSYANSALLDSPDTIYIRLQYLCRAASTTSQFQNGQFIRLETSLLKFFVKNDLKIQNRSVNVNLDNDADDVTNCPVYGKSYSGAGVGSRMKTLPGSTGLALTANGSTGIMIQRGTALNNLVPGSMYNEPLEYQHFANVNKVGKIHIDAGQMKTSILTRSFTMSFNNFMNAVAPSSSDPVTPAGSADLTIAGRAVFRLKKMALFRFFAVEKMLDAQSTSLSNNTTPITLAFEHNSKIMCQFIEKYEDITSLSFVKNRVTTIPA